MDGKKLLSSASGYVFMMSSLLLIAVLLLALVKSSDSYYGTGIDLTILHTNDAYGQLDEACKSGSACTLGHTHDHECFGGAARMYVYIYIDR